MYKLIDRMDEPSRLALLKQPREWKHKLGEFSDYWADDDSINMFVKICPGGKMHKHTDAGKPRIHWVLQTNERCESWSAGRCYHLQQGGIYEVDVNLEHESFNKGDTDRIHLVR